MQYKMSWNILELVPALSKIPEDSFRHGTVLHGMFPKLMEVGEVP